MNRGLEPPVILSALLVHFWDKQLTGKYISHIQDKSWQWKIQRKNPLNVNLLNSPI